MASPKAIEAARAVNSLLGLSSRDQEALISVVKDYFTSPDEETADSDWMALMTLTLSKVEQILVHSPCKRMHEHLYMRIFVCGCMCVHVCVCGCMCVYR